MLIALFVTFIFIITLSVAISKVYLYEYTVVLVTHFKYNYDLWILNENITISAAQEQQLMVWHAWCCKYGSNQVKCFNNEQSNCSVLLRKDVHHRVQLKSMKICVCQSLRIERHVLFRNEHPAPFCNLWLLQPQVPRSQWVQRDSDSSWWWLLMSLWRECHRLIRSHHQLLYEFTCTCLLRILLSTRN